MPGVLPTHYVGRPTFHIRDPCLLLGLLWVAKAFCSAIVQECSGRFSLIRPVWVGSGVGQFSHCEFTHVTDVRRPDRPVGVSTRLHEAVFGKSVINVDGLLNLKHDA